MITPYVTIVSRLEFSRNTTGFGYMVYDIANAVGKSEQVHVLCTDSRNDGFEDDGVVYLKRSLPSFLKHMNRCLSLGTFIKITKGYKIRKGTTLRLLYYWIITGYLSSLLKRGKYDAVHIHGCGFATELWMRVCKNSNQKYIVTLHGLNSFSDTVNLELAGKKYERDFLQRVVKGEILITVISTGMKKLIENTYNVKDCSNIVVVCNSFSFKDGGDGNTKDVRSIYNIPKDAKIILYVGNVSENKNQRQMVEAFGLLQEELQKMTYVLFCGRPDNSINLDMLIEKQTYREHLILCGAIDKEDMPDYYKVSDVVVLLSYTEGFGLSLIEGMHFGLPCMMFSDMDAFEDIYDDRYVLGVEKRDNIFVAKGLQQLLSKDWNRKAIVEYSEKFNSISMANNYIDVFKSVIEL